MEDELIRANLKVVKLDAVRCYNLFDMHVILHEQYEKDAELAKPQGFAPYEKRVIAKGIEQLEAAEKFFKKAKRLKFWIGIWMRKGIESCATLEPG